MGMKPTFRVKCFRKNEIECFLQEKSIVIKEEAEYLITDNNHNLKHKLLAINNSSYEIIDYSDIHYIEAIQNSVFCITKDAKLVIQYKLYELEEILEDYFFIRIHKSFLVNLKMINKVIPESNSKFTLVMNNNDQIYVSRRYIKEFKDYFGL